MTVTVNCQRCGQPMPPLPAELTAVLQAGTPVQIVHEKCPGTADDHDLDPGRYFEVRTQIVEIKPAAPPSTFAGTVNEQPEVVELVDFRFGVRADNLAAAMRPLAAGLGEKWMHAEEHAGIADPPRKP